MNARRSVRRAPRSSTFVLALAFAAAAPAARAQSPSPGSDRSAQAMAELAKLPPDVQHDCIGGGLGAMLLLGVYQPNATVEHRLKVADKLAALSAKMKVPRVQKIYATMADEVRAHASDSPFQPPKLEAAGNDLAAWQKATCPDPKAH